MQKNFIPIAQACAITGKSKRTIYYAISNKGVQSHVQGGKRLVAQEDLEKLYGKTEEESAKESAIAQQVAQMGKETPQRQGGASVQSGEILKLKEKEIAELKKTNEKLERGMTRLERKIDEAEKERRETEKEHREDMRQLQQQVQILLAQTLMLKDPRSDIVEAQSVDITSEPQKKREKPPQKEKKRPWYKRIKFTL